MAKPSVSQRTVALLLVVFVALFLAAGVPVCADDDGPGGLGGDPDPGGANPGWHPLPAWVHVLSGFYILFLP